MAPRATVNPRLRSSIGVGERGATAGALTLVVPLFNEVRRFAETADRLHAFVAAQPHGSELVFVDDGSTDGTAELVERCLAAGNARARLIRRPHQGKGAAVAAGLASIRTDVAAFCDVDLSTSLDDLASLVDTARRGDVLVIGSRDVAGSRVERRQQPHREVLGRAFNRLAQLLVAPGVRDTQCGAKAARREVWEAIVARCEEPGFAWDVEAIGVARRLGIPVHEVGVEWQHDERSRVRVASDGARMVRSVLRIARRLRTMDGTRPEVFGDELAATLVDNDVTHWWFRSKAAFVADALRRFAPLADHRAMLLDVGAGAGGVTAMLGWPAARSVVVDGSSLLCDAARTRHGLLSVNGDAEHLPTPDRSVSVVSMLDVIEHLDAPADALREAARVLDDEGIVVVNVPAHTWLWSRADEHLGHRRRYTRRRLRRDLAAAGLRPVWMSHVFSWAVLPVLLQRRTARSAEASLGLQHDSAFVDRVAMVLTRVEMSIVRRVRLPVGTSLLCIASPRRPR